jgi:dienelactone hydrolase
VDPDRIAALGFCFGGTAVLELARAGADLKGVISFHGGLDSPDPAAGKAIKAKVLVLHGADDPYVPKKDIAAFEDELKAAGVDYQLVFYSGAVHAFTQKEAGNDNSKGAAYNANADRRSWKALLDFLDEIFK